MEDSERYKLKKIRVIPGKTLSLHHHRSEHWVMVTGTACVHVGEDDILRFDDDYGRV